MLGRIFTFPSESIAQIISFFQTHVAIAVTQEVAPHLRTLSKSIRDKDRAFNLYREQLNQDFEKWQRDFAAEPYKVGEDYLNYLRKLEKKFQSDKNKQLAKKPKNEKSTDYINAEKNLITTQNEINRVKNILSEKPILQSKTSATSSPDLTIQNLNFMGPIKTVKVNDGIYYFIEQDFSLHDYIYGDTAADKYNFVTAEIFSNSTYKAWKTLNRISIPTWIYPKPLSDSSSYFRQNGVRPNILFKDKRALLTTSFDPHHCGTNPLLDFDISDPQNLRLETSFEAVNPSGCIVDLASSANADFVYAATYLKFPYDSNINGVLRLMYVRNDSFSFTSYPYNPSAPLYEYPRIATDESGQYLVALNYIYKTPNLSYRTFYDPLYTELHIYQIYPDITTSDLLHRVGESQKWFINDFLLSKEAIYTVNNYYESAYDLITHIQKISFDGQVLQTKPVGSIGFEGPEAHVALAQTNENLYVLYKVEGLYVFAKEDLTQIRQYDFQGLSIYDAVSMAVHNADIVFSSYTTAGIDIYSAYALFQNYNVISARVNITQYGELTLLTRNNFLVSGTIDPSLISWSLSENVIQIEDQPFGQLTRNFTQSQINHYAVYAIFYNNRTINATVSVPGRASLSTNLQLNLITHDRDPQPPAPPPIPIPPAAHNTTVFVTSSDNSNIGSYIGAGLFGAVFAIGVCCFCASRRCRCRGHVPAAQPQQLPVVAVQMVDVKVEQPRAAQVLQIDVPIPRLHAPIEAVEVKAQDQNAEQAQGVAINQLPSYDQAIQSDAKAPEDPQRPPQFVPGVPSAFAFFQPGRERVVTPIARRHSFSG